MSLKILRFLFGHGVTHARITPDTTCIVPSGLMMFLIPVTEYILSMVKQTSTYSIKPRLAPRFSLRDTYVRTAVSSSSKVIAHML